ncbi:MAG: hypothetical protein ACRDLF_05980 [Solirubrobacteraceae bacterium]
MSTARDAAIQTRYSTVQGRLPVALPLVESTGALVRALWQAPLVYPTVTGNLVVGLLAGREEGELEAVSTLTGQAMWSASLPMAKLSVMGLLTGGGVLVVELGHGVGYAGELVVTRDVIYDATSGRQLWSLNVTEGDKYGPSHQPIAYSQGVVVTGAASGALTARNAHTGSVAWRRTRPPSCPQAQGNEYKYAEHVAADGALLVASYPCASPGHEFVLVQRLDPRTGAPLWQWRSIAVAGRSPHSFIELNVVGAATQGDEVLLNGQVTEAVARRYARMLPRARQWPVSLGPTSDGELVLALDGRTGKPRWTEIGGQLEEFTLTDGVTCETVNAGFECRNDQTGLLSRPVLAARSEGDAPPYEGDGRAGISGDVAGVVLSQAPSGSVSVAVLPLHGHKVIARATVQLGNTTYRGANEHNFIVGAGPLPGGGTLLLLRRVDIAGYPLVALSVKLPA